jgi:Glycine rich protein
MSRVRALLLRLVPAACAAALACALSPAAASASQCATGWTAQGSELCVLMFSYTGGPQTMTVPAGVAMLKMVAVGGAGPGGYLGEPEYEGDGGGFGGELPITAGTKLTVIVGGAGHVASSTEGAPGGYGGGGKGGNYEGTEAGRYGADGGGGGSFIFAPGNKLLMAGGGGGGGGGGGDGGGGTGARGCCESGGGDTSLHGGEGGTQSAGGAPGNYPEVAAITVPSAGKGPAGGPSSLGEGGTGGSGKYAAGSGGGGGYYGGGGGWPGGGSGGGGGSGYAAPGTLSLYYSSGEPGDNGFVEFGYSTSSTHVSGTITNPFKEGEGKQGQDGVKVRLTGGSTTEETTTTENGKYSFAVKPGTYTVTPVATNLPAGADEFETEQCAGKAGLGTCESIVVAEGENAVASFDAGFTVSGKAIGLEGKGVEGATVVFQDEEQGKLESATTTTNAEGRFKERLAPGSVMASVKKLQETEFFPDASPDCKPSNVSCEINLNEDREVELSACVVPNPNGEALPSNTPSTIPGAKTAGNLEAVGCWAPQNANAAGEATIYTSTKPVRLDGIDVKPSQGTTLQLDTTAGPTVTSDGPAQLLIGGWPVTPALNISLNYQGSTQLSVSDQGAGTGPLAPNLFGLPISLGSGGPAGYGLPFSESPGQTTINGGLQIPLNTHATWNPAAGVFQEPQTTIAAVKTGQPSAPGIGSVSLIDTNETVPSLGLSGSIIASNRLGLTGQVCLSINDLATDKLVPFLPDGYDDGEISGAQVCWLPAQGLWEGSGMFKLPSALARYVGDIFVKLTAQKAQPNDPSTQFLGYKLQRFGLQFEHLNSKTFLVPEVASVRASGIPIGLGFYLQSLGGEFSNNVTTGAVSEIKGTMGISYGPEINTQVGEYPGTELSLLRGDLEFALLPSGPGVEYWTYRLAGALSFARLSPLELQLAAAKVVYHANPTKPEADFYAQLGGSFLGVGDTLSVSGQSEGNVGLLLEGTRTIKFAGQTATFDAILNNSLLGVCVTANGNPVWGFDENLAAPLTAASWGCNLGKFKHPSGAASAAVSRVAHLRLRRGLTGAVIAVRGTDAAPSVRLTGGGRAIATTPTIHPREQDGAMVFDDPAKHTTYIGLLRPRAGTWTVHALPGSAAIAEVLQAEPGPGPRVRAKVVRAGCSDELRYRVRSTAGDRILVYAQQGTGHVYVGTLHAGAGALKLGLLAAVKGRGKLVAYYLRGKLPEGTAALATFADAASNGSEKPSHLKLHAGTLRWQAACAAASYTVAVTRAGKTSSQNTTKPQFALPAGSGRALVSVTALTSGGLTLGDIRKTLP